MIGQHDPQSIIKWHRLDARVTTSGQPSEEQLAMMQSLGVRHVINLALHSHERALPDEAGSLATLGISYTHIPVVFQHPTEADFERFRREYELLQDALVHVHCIMNYRVSAFFYRYRRQVLGWSDAKARPDLESLWRPDPIWSRFCGFTA